MKKDIVFQIKGVLSAVHLWRSQKSLTVTKITKTILLKSLENRGDILQALTVHRNNIKIEYFAEVHVLCTLLSQGDKRSLT